MKKKQNIHDIYEDRMRAQYKVHEIPCNYDYGEYNINWYPKDYNGKIEYELTVSDLNSGKTLRGTFEQWKKSKNLK